MLTLGFLGLGAGSPTWRVDSSWTPQGPWTSAGNINIWPSDGAGTKTMTGHLGRGQWGAIAISVPAGAVTLSTVTVTFKTGAPLTLTLNQAVAPGQGAIVIDFGEPTLITSLTANFGAVTRETGLAVHTAPYVAPPVPEPPPVVVPDPAPAEPVPLPEKKLWPWLLGGAFAIGLVYVARRNSR